MDWFTPACRPLEFNFGYHKSLELDNGSNEAADDGTGTHHLIDTCFKYGFKSADIFLNKTLKSSVGESLSDLPNLTSLIRSFE
jgi:hypothetical protein